MPTVGARPSPTENHLLQMKVLDRTCQVVNEVFFTPCFFVPAVLLTDVYIFRNKRIKNRVEIFVSRREDIGKFLCPQSKEK